MGPSKEELTNYFKNNRKYFDELASFYKQTDPTYYNKYIAPFYSSLLTTMGGKRSVKPQIAILAASIFVLIMGTILIFLVNISTHDIEINEDEETEIGTESDNINLLNDETEFNELGDYEKGIIYYQLGKYDKAEKFLEKVPQNSPLYDDARLKLIEIRKKEIKKP